MHFTLPLTALAALASASLTLAAPASIPPSPRAATWNDPYIKQPTSFQFRQVAGCAYQLTFNRDSVDSRYAYFFEARYPSGARASVSPISDRSNLAISTSGPTGTIPPYTLSSAPYTLSALPFGNACSSSGERPSSIVAKARLQGGYTYTNNWDSPALAPIADGALPGVPANARAVGANGSTGRTATWDAVAGATSYFVLTQYPYYNSEVGGDLPQYQTSEVPAGGVLSVAIPSRASRLSVVARSGGKLSDVTKVPTVAI